MLNYSSLAEFYYLHYNTQNNITFCYLTCINHLVSYSNMNVIKELMAIIVMITSLMPVEGIIGSCDDFVRHLNASDYAIINRIEKEAHVRNGRSR